MQSQTSYYLNNDNNILNIPFHDANQSNLNLLFQIISPGDILLLKNFGFHENIQFIIEKLGLTGSLIDCESNLQSFQFIVDAMQRFQYFNNSLILRSKHVYSLFDSINYEVATWFKSTYSVMISICYSQSFDKSLIVLVKMCENLNQLSFSKIHDLIGSSKVDTIYIGNKNHETFSNSTIEELLGAGRLIKRQYPNIIIDIVQPFESQSLCMVLESYDYKYIYFIVKFIYQDDFIIGLHKVSIIALREPRLYEQYQNTSDIWLLYKPGKYYLFQYLDMNTINMSIPSNELQSLLAWSPSCQDIESIGPCQPIIRKKYVYDIARSIVNTQEISYPKLKPNNETLKLSDIKATIYLEAILDWKFDENQINFGNVMFLSNLIQHFESSLQKTSKSKSLNSLMISWDPIISPTNEFIDTFAKYQCLLWLHNITYLILQDLNNKYLEYNITLSEVNSFYEILLFYDYVDKRLIRLCSYCSEFMIKQYWMNRETSISAAIDSLRYSYLHVNKIDNNIYSNSFNVSSKAYLPFQYSYSPSECFEPLWCDHTQEIQKRIFSWQHPDFTNASLGQVNDRRSCQHSKFLIYEPMSHIHGIGSIIQQLASVFRYALCHQRILVLNPMSSEKSMLKWKFSGCKDVNTLECYFETIHGCLDEISYDDLRNAPIAHEGLNLDKYPLRDLKFIRLTGLPLHGPCSICGQTWDKNSLQLFDGLVIHRNTVDKSKTYLDAALDVTTSNMLHFGAMLTETKLPWIAQFIRYFFHPRKWFQDLLIQIVKQGLVGESLKVCNGTIPKPFISLHVRYGMKALEEQLQPLERYMNAIKTKFPLHKNIFVSTETEDILFTLRE